MGEQAKLYGAEGIPDRESSVYSFHLTLFSDADEMYELWLPRVPEGHFLFSDRPEHKFLNVFAKDGRWIAACRKTAYFLEVPLADSTETVLSDATLLKISYDERSYKLLVEKVTQRRSVFQNYNLLTSKLEISIGNHPDNDIYYQGPFVSRRHAVIFRDNGQWSIKSHNEMYGIFVNGEKKTYCHLKLGDVIYIMGLKIIVGHSALAINNGLGTVTVSSRILQDAPIIRSGHSYYYNEESAGDRDSFFNRAPRKRRESEQKVITVEGPPMSMSQKNMPLMLRMGSSMVMGGAAAMAGNFMTLITSVLFPFLSSKYTDAQRKEYEQLRTTKYTEYLEKKRCEIMEAIKIEQRELNIKYPTLDRVTEIGRSEHLWERRPSDSDFLQLRLGTGSRPFSTQIEYPQRRFELETDELEEKMYQLVEAPHRVSNAPILLPLIDAYVSGIQGDREQILSVIRSLVLQIAVHHSYDEVKMVFLLRQEELAEMDSLRYIPHVWDDTRSNRFIATNEMEAYTVGEYIQSQIEDETEEKKDVQKLLKKRPYYIVLALDKKLFDGHEVFKRLLKEDQNPGVSVITAYNGLPKECQKIISLQGQSNTCTTMGIDGGEDEIFSTESLTNEQFHKTMHLLANTRLKQMDKAQALPKMVTFLEMFKVGHIEQLNVLKRWRENNPVKSLAAPLGVGEDGSLFMLDLHEKRQGPHGLVAGMTGSGKSELLITYILSMAINYHPDEVSFVLIDYKGGGLADAFENPRTGVKLPHLAGTITNLDGASIQRSLMSIESELVRRQREFSRVGKELDMGSMNIYNYQKLYRAGKVSKPMPHLFVISDEFAELKQQQPEFMEKLISAARIGRSLGVHLILATQKPSGVVNDQIRSNTKFRVCMRVQDRSDSMDMLKRPEAAELTDTGRFYLQVGYNELFALGQSAWCGADYEPQDTAPVQRDDAVEFLDITGQVVTKNKPKVKKASSGMKQIGAVVRYLHDLAEREHTRSPRLWQPELPKLMDLRQQDSSGAIGSGESPYSVCLGLMDDPVNQTQIPMEVDFSQISNTLVVGSNGSGKTTFIQNTLYALSKRLPPDAFNFYVLDYSSRRLKAFQKLPHCGAVLYEEDSNSLDAFFALVNEMLAERKALFSKLGADSFELASSIEKMPLVVVVIDNFAGLIGNKKGENLAYQLPACLKECSGYGIKFIISCTHSNDVPSKVRQNMETRYCFAVNDRYEYSDVLNVKVGYAPPDLPGRGLCVHGMRPLEFQMGTYWANMNSKEQIIALRDEVEEIKNVFAEYEEARHLPTVDENVTYAEFASQFSKGRIPIGFSKATGKHVALPLKQYTTLGIYLGNPQGKRSILSNLLLAASREKMEVWVVRQHKESLFENPTDNFDEKLLKEADYIGSSPEDVSLLQKALAATMTQRKEIIREFCNKAGIDPESADANRLAFEDVYAQTKPIFVLIENLSDFIGSLNPVMTFAYRALLEKTNWRNIYVAACLEPGAPAEIAKNEVFNLLGSQNVLLFGGQYDKQQLCPMLADSNAAKQLPFNMAVMQYNKKLHPVAMPCGVMEIPEVDRDLESIF